jgi:hypothetical protein
VCVWGGGGMMCHVVSQVLCSARIGLCVGGMGCHVVVMVVEG